MEKHQILRNSISLRYQTLYDDQEDCTDRAFDIGLLRTTRKGGMNTKAIQFYDLFYPDKFAT